MYPSPRFQIPDTNVAPSPKKKLRPNATRQLFALPAIKQFDPVLMSPRASPSTTAFHFDERTYGEDSPSALVSPTPNLFAPSPLPRSPHQPLRPKLDDKVSPRLRPQPPMHAAAVASRTDQDLFRYSQGVKQRMSIRPLFEQRREEEAEVARTILTSRGSEGAQSRQSQRDTPEIVAVPYEDTTTLPPRRSAQSSSRRATTPITASEIADLAAGGPSPRQLQSPATTTRPTSRSSGARSGVPSEATEEDGAETNAIVQIRFRTPTPPSSAGPRRGQIADSLAIAPADETEISDDQYEATVAQSNELKTAAEHNANTAPEPEGVVSTSGLVDPLKPALLHEPFVEKQSTKLSWLQQRHKSVKPSASSGNSPSQSRDRTAATVCYKTLWKTLRAIKTNSDETENAYVLRVLLGSNGKAHVAINPSNDEAKEVKLPISEANLLDSTKTRPDLSIMTPRWAKYVLSRVETDDRGVWFLRLQDIGAMADLCVFEDDVAITLRGMEAKETHTVSVTMYLLGDDASASPELALLVHARDRSTTGAPLSEIVLKYDELAVLASPRVTSEDSDPSTERGQLSLTELREKLRDKDFLRSVIAEGNALRLALMSGLHVTDEAESIADLPYRSGSRAATASARALSRDGTPSPVGDVSMTERLCATAIAEYEAQGLTYASDDIRAIVSSHEAVAEISFIAQAYCEDSAKAALKWFQQRDAVEAYVMSYIHSGADDQDASLAEAVRQRIDAAKQAKLEEIAILSLVEDMISDFIAVECRVELHHMKHSGGYDDFYASKVQATYRMSYHRRGYENRRNVRLRAARLIQALQRGILARKRYTEMRIEREKYLFYGFRSSLHQATSGTEDPRQRAADLARETERRRQTFLMQVLHGYVAKHGIPVPFRISCELVQHVINEYSVAVGCPPTLGNSVAAILSSSRYDHVPHATVDRKTLCSPRLFGSSEIHAALVTALRMQYDDTYGLSSGIRHLDASTRSPSKRTQILVAGATREEESQESTPPRWLLKINAPFQRANRNRVAAQRLSRKTTGQQAAHLVALDYRSLLVEAYQDFDKCRAIWEAGIRSRREQLTQFDAFTIDELVQYVLDRLVIAVKDWGIDSEPLFDALNVCLRHRLGKQAVSGAEQAFNRYADGLNESLGKRGVLSLRDEIAQELEEFEALVATRCLNIANENVATVPPSEILHVLLFGRVDEEYLRHALPSVLPIASVNEKVQLAYKIIRVYAGASYGDAFNAICWSCLDTAENVTVEAAQFLDRISRDEDGDVPVASEDATALEGATKSSSIVARALYVLTGSHALRFLQFLAKVAHFNRSVQRRVLQCFAPYATQLEFYRLASVLCSMDSFEVAARLFDANFEAESVYKCTRFWVQYGSLYGEDQAETSRASCGATVVQNDAAEPSEPAGIHDRVRQVEEKGGSTHVLVSA